MRTVICKVLEQVLMKMQKYQKIGKTNPNRDKIDFVFVKVSGLFISVFVRQASMHQLFEELVHKCAEEWEFGYETDYSELNNIADLPESVRKIIDDIIELKLVKPVDNELLRFYEAHSGWYNPNKKGRIDYGALALIRVSYDIISKAY